MFKGFGLVVKKNKPSAYLAYTLLGLLSGCQESDSPEPPPPNLPIASACVDDAKWAVQGKGNVRSTAVVIDDAVFFGDSHGNLYSVNKVNGAINWQVALEGALDSKLQQYKSNIVVSSDAGILYSVNKDSGELSWQSQLGKVQRREYDYNIASATIYQETAIIGTESGEVLGIDLDNGAVSWTTQLFDAIHSVPLVTDDIICVSSVTDLSCLDSQSHALKWRINLDWPSSPTSDGQHVYVGSRWDYGVYAFAIESGEQVWKQDVVDWAPGEPVVNNDVVYIGSSDNHAFLALDALSGERLWRVDTVANVFTKAALFDSGLIFSSGYAYNNPGFGIVKAVDFSGDELWSVTGCNFFSSPIIDEQSVFIGSDDGFFYAIDLP